VFIGYADGTKAYRVYDPVSQHVLVLRDVVFDETCGWDWSKSADHVASMAEELIIDYELITTDGSGAQGASPTAASSAHSPAPGETASAALMGDTPNLHQVMLHALSSPALASSPVPVRSAPTTPAAAEQAPIESATPLEDDEDCLDAFYNGEPLQYRTIENIISDKAIPGVEPRLCT